MATTRPLAQFTRLILRPSSYIQARHLSLSRPLLAQVPQPESQKAAQNDREKMSVEPNEYSKSGTDSESAANQEAAFNTDTPKPEDAKAKAGEGNEVNPLNASPANQEISKGTSEEEGGLPKKMSEGGGGRQGGGDSTGNKSSGSSV